MGTLLQEQGLQAGELPETWNLKNPEPIIQIHKAYLAAGADIILANTFGANRFKYGEDLEKIVTAGVANAKKAVAESGKKAYVALDIGSTGKLLKPMGTLDFEEAVGVFAEIIRAGEKAGADLILIETMSDTYELKAAVLAAKENSTLPIMATVIFDESKKMLTGASPQVVVSLLEGLGVDALGINCGLGPKQMKEIVKELLKYASIPVIVNPNAGLPRSENGKTVFDVGARGICRRHGRDCNHGSLVRRRLLRNHACAYTGNGRKMQRNHTGADHTEELYLCYLLLYGS